MGRTEPASYTPDWSPPEYRVDADGRVVDGYRPTGPNNWERWGADDQRGTTNLLTPERLVAAAGLVRRGTVFSLTLAIDAAGPRFPARAAPKHYFSQTGSDVVVGTPLNVVMPGFTYNDDAIDMPLQGSTQWDGLGHVVVEDTMYNGYWGGNVTALAGASTCGIEQQASAMAGRGVLLDLPRHLGVERVPEGTAITPDDLDACAEAQGVEIGQGDMLLIRTGDLLRWWALESLDDRAAYFATSPGLSRDCIAWLAEKDVATLAADNVGIEVIPNEEPVDRVYPVHQAALVDLGLTLGEFWVLDDLAADCADDGVWEFLLVAPPMRIPGAVGSPVNPYAIK